MPMATIKPVRVTMFKRSGVSQMIARLKRKARGILMETTNAARRLARKRKITSTVRMIAWMMELRIPLKFKSMSGCWSSVISKRMSGYSVCNRGRNRLTVSIASTVRPPSGRRMLSAMAGRPFP